MKPLNVQKSLIELKKILIFHIINHK